jgi:hypothetical protein
VLLLVVAAALASGAQDVAKSAIMEKKFSLTALIVTTIVTALVSAIIGGYSDDFFGRAKPSISLLSVGFQAPSQADSVRLPDEVSTMSKQAHWDVGVERFEPFARVLAVEQRNRSWIQEANELITSLEEWKSKYVARRNSVYPLAETLLRVRS